MVLIRLEETWRVPSSTLEGGTTGFSFGCIGLRLLVGRLYLPCQVLVLSLLYFTELLGEVLILHHLLLDYLSAPVCCDEPFGVHLLSEVPRIWGTPLYRKCIKKFAGDAETPRHGFLTSRFARIFRHSLGSLCRPLRNDLTRTPWSHLDAGQSFSRDVDGVGPGVDRPCSDNSAIRSGHHVLA